MQKLLLAMALDDNLPLWLGCWLTQQKAPLVFVFFENKSRITAMSYKKK
jgi:hypothetical protein